MSHKERANGDRTGRRPSPTTRFLAAICMVALLQVHWAGLVQHGNWIAEAQAQAIVTNTMAILVVPPNRRNVKRAIALERLLGSYIPRLEQVVPFELSPVEGIEQEGKIAALVEQSLRALLLRTPQRASDRLKAAQKLLNKYPSAGDVRLYARFFKALSLVALARQKLVESRNAMLKSEVLFPTQAEEEYVAYGSLARDLFRTVKSTYEGAPTGDLLIASKPKQAQLWVDGIYRGTTPLKVSDLPIGDHRLTVRAPGMTAERRFVTVNAAKPEKVKVTLKPAAFHEDLRQGRSVLIANFNQPTVIEDRIRELRNELGTDQIMVVRAGFTRQQTEMKGYFLGADGAFKKVQAVIPKDENYLTANANFVAESSGAKLLPDPGKQPLDHRKSVVVASKKTATSAADAIDPNAPLFQSDAEVEEPITGKWWFWASVGGGVLLITGVVVLLGAIEPPPPEGATGTLKIGLHQPSDG